MSVLPEFVYWNDARAGDGTLNCARPLTSGDDMGNHPTRHSNLFSYSSLRYVCQEKTATD